MHKIKSLPEIATTSSTTTEAALSSPTIRIIMPNILINEKQTDIEPLADIKTIIQSSPDNNEQQKQLSSKNPITFDQNKKVNDLKKDNKESTEKTIINGSDDNRDKIIDYELTTESLVSLLNDIKDQNPNIDINSATNLILKSIISSNIILADKPPELLLVAVNSEKENEISKGMLNNKRKENYIVRNESIINTISNNLLIITNTNNNTSIIIEEIFYFIPAIASLIS